MIPLLVGLVGVVGYYALKTGQDDRLDDSEESMIECRSDEGVVKIIKNDEESVIVEPEDRAEDEACEDNDEIDGKGEVRT